MSVPARFRIPPHAWPWISIVRPPFCSSHCTVVCFICLLSHYTTKHKRKYSVAPNSRFTDFLRKNVFGIADTYVKVVLRMLSVCVCIQQRFLNYWMNFIYIQYSRYHGFLYITSSVSAYLSHSKIIRIIQSSHIAIQ